MENTSSLTQFYFEQRRKINTILAPKVSTENTAEKKSTFDYIMANTHTGSPRMEQNSPAFISSTPQKYTYAYITASYNLPGKT